ncbi:MAG: hypothetical protein QG657_1911 [Acidobacteriota bacterium]|nr:hypothetical protein [Acidobacteriota bacterium]
MFPSQTPLLMTTYRHGTTIGRPRAGLRTLEYGVNKRRQG